MATNKSTTHNVTNEFSFILKPSKHGIGVFAVYDIKKGTFLRLFGDEKKFDNRVVFRDKKTVPELFRGYCMDRGNKLACPSDFGNMPVGWHLNHSENPNAKHRDYDWYASRDISAGEEITIDYNTLEEPEEAKEDYYKKKDTKIKMMKKIK